MKYFSFEKKNRLLYKNKIFLKKFNINKSKFFKIYYFNSNLLYPRLGIFINKKYIKLSNKRNFLKRIIKENFRINKYKILYLDYIFKLNLKINFKENIKFIKEDIKNIFYCFKK